MAEEFDGYVTVYALTEGIRKIKLRSTSVLGMVYAAGVQYPMSYYGEGKDWHRTLESAVARANDMRGKKIASLRKSIEKMESLKFDVLE